MRIYCSFQIFTPDLAVRPVRVRRVVYVLYLTWKIPAFCYLPSLFQLWLSMAFKMSTLCHQRPDHFSFAKKIVLWSEFNYFHVFSCTFITEPIPDRVPRVGYSQNRPLPVVVPHEVT